MNHIVRVVCSSFSGLVRTAWVLHPGIATIWLTAVRHHAIVYRVVCYKSESVASAWHWYRKSTIAWIPLFYRLIDSNVKPEPTTAAYNTKYNDNLFNAITTGRKLHAPEIHRYSKYLAFRLPASKLRHEWTAVMSDWAAYDRNLCDVKKYFHRNDSKKNVLLPVKMRQTMVQSTS